MLAVIRFPMETLPESGSPQGFSIGNSLTKREKKLDKHLIVHIFVSCCILSGTMTAGIFPTVQPKIKDMKTQTVGVRSKSETGRPRRQKPMLDRAMEYAKLHKKGMSATEMEKKFNENYITVCKLIRLGEAPQAVIKLIKDKKVSATLVQNSIKASMTPDEVLKMVNAMVKERQESRKKLEDLGYKGGTSITLKRALGIALDNVKKRRLIKSSGRKSIINVLNSIVSQSKPTAASIERAILTA